MTRYLLQNRHEPHECAASYASFKGYESRLRGRSALASCRSGEHTIWWDVEAASDRDALALLPFYVAERTIATIVSEVPIP